jgi:hypothetical protein
MMLKAEVERFIIPEFIRTSKDVLRLLGKIMDNDRAANVTSNEITTKEAEVRRLRDNLAERENKKEQEIIELGMLLMNMMEQQANNNRVHFEDIFIDDNEQQNRLRVDLHDLIRLIRFTYCLDPIAPIQEQTVDEVMRIMRRANN